jgi:hypothetical protein
MFKKLKFVPLVLLALASTLTFQACMSGGWKITRTVARWNNSLSILPRILIYIAFFIIPVYGVASLIDAIVFNTIDFWNGTVSAMNYNYKKDGMDVSVAHTRFPLRQSIITTRKGDVVKSEVKICELTTGKIALYVDGVLRGEVNNIKEVDPALTVFNEDGVTVAFTKTISANDMKLAAMAPQQSPADFLKALDIKVPNRSIVSVK